MNFKITDLDWSCSMAFEIPSFLLCITISTLLALCQSDSQINTCIKKKNSEGRVGVTPVKDT